MNDSYSELRKKKFLRERNLLRTFCDNYVPTIMEQNQLQYVLCHNKKGTVVSVNIKENKWAEFRFKTCNSEQFMERISKIPERVKALKAIYETFDGDITIIKRPTP
ncbi:MAG: hypothetical protein HUK12_09565 [Muribaculaceae bacterium]|nr:hypothetical protein [Muribaculaceae bacterium]